MRPEGSVLWETKAVRLSLKEAPQLRRNPVMGNQEAVIVGQRDEMPIEEPMYRARERDAVLDHVGATLFDWPDMCGLHLGAPAAVDDPQPGDGAGIVIGLADEAPKVRVTDFSIHQRLLDPADEVLSGDRWIAG